MNKRSIRVIIIDDDPEIIDSIKNFLEDRYYIEGFTSYREGLKRLKEQKFDLLILDYYIDELNENNVIDEIKKYNNDLYILRITDFAKKVSGRKSLEIQNHYGESGNFKKLITFIEVTIKSMEFFKSEKPTIGKRIKELRKQHALSQEQVSKYLGIQRSNISLYESGDATPPAMTIIKLATLFNVTTDYILCYELNVEKKIHLK